MIDTRQLEKDELAVENARLRAELKEMEQYTAELRAAHPLNGSDENRTVHAITTWYKWKITAALRGDQ